MAEIRINTTGGLKLYDADNSHYAQIVAGTITSNVDAITLGHDTVTIADNLSLGSDSAILKFGADTEIALTHVADTGLKLTDSGGTPTLQLHDANESIASDGSKVIITSGGTAFSLPTSDGSSGQVLSTNGSGVLSFATASSADPSSADGDSLGTASAEWSDLFLADGGIIYFGNDQDVTLTHDPDDGLFLKSIATADNNPVLLTLQTGETDMAADDVIGKIAFQAPDEGTGTDAILVSAAIQAVAEGDHSSSSNATRLEFMTGASEAATAKMTLSSAGLLRLGGSTSPDAAADNLVMQGSGDTGMSIFSGGSDKASIFLGTDGANNDCKLEYDNDANSLVIHTNASEALKITSDNRGLSQFTAKVWANLNGNSFGLRDSHNLSSATDNGTGDYTFTFSNALANTNYAVVSTASNGTSHGDFQGVDAVVNATGNVRIYTCFVSATNSGSSAHNVLDLHIAIFGD